MTAAPLTCPYCNAHVTVAPGSPAGARVACPRCGESFALLRPADAFQPPPGVTATPPAAMPAPDVRRRRSNRLVGGAVLGVMLLMAAGGLTYALYTRGVRRAHDTGIPRRSRRPALPPVTAVTPTPPARLAALGYVPPRTSALVGLHVAELLATEAGRALLDDPVKMAGAEFRPSSLIGWTGFKLEDVDHAVLASRPGAVLPPPLLLIVRTRQPYDARQVRADLKADRAGGGGDKAVYSFKPSGSRLVLHLWSADERTLLVGLVPEDFKDVPRKPTAGADHLGELGEVLTKRVGAGGPAWAVARGTQFGALATLAVGERLPKEDAKRLQALRAVALWVQPGKQVDVRGAARWATPEAAGAAEDAYLVPWKEREPSLKFERDDEWLTVEFKTDPNTIRNALGK